jgi:hypothetical protein
LEETKMKKALALILTLIMALSLVACGEKAPADEGGDDAASTELNVFMWGDYISETLLTNFEQAKRRYARFGYRLPRVVFWNVQSRNEQQPVRSNEQGVALVSGCTPRIFSQVMSGELDPYRNMLQVLLSERYAPICA